MAINFMPEQQLALHRLFVALERIDDSPHGTLHQKGAHPRPPRRLYLISPLFPERWPTSQRVDATLYSENRGTKAITIRPASLLGQINPAVHKTYPFDDRLEPGVLPEKLGAFVFLDVRRPRWRRLVHGLFPAGSAWLRKKKISGSDSVSGYYVNVDTAVKPLGHTQKKRPPIVLS